MRLWNRIRHWSRRRRFEADLAEELRIHREMAAESGAPPAAFGSVALALEDSRAVWRFAWLASLAQDVSYAIRSFRKSPGFALTVIGTLALGLGILASAFGFFSALVLRPFSVRDPWSLYTFAWQNRDAAQPALTWRQFTDLRKQSAIFSDMLGGQVTTVPIDGTPATVQAVTGNYFTMLGARICLGRPILESDDVPGRAAVAVLNHQMWENRYGRDANILGRKLYVRAQPAEIVGVACPEFNGVEVGRISAWLSLGLSGVLVNGPDLFGPEQPQRLTPVGRLQPGVSPDRAKSALLAYARQADIRFGLPKPGRLPTSVFMVSRATLVAWDRSKAAGVMPVFLAFGLILLIACANVSNMMLARCLARQREIGIRISLGAGRARVVRQLLTESLSLALPSALAAFAIASAALRAFVWLVQHFMSARQLAASRIPDLSPDIRVLAFLFAAAGIATLAFGLMPAVQSTRSSLVEANRGEFANDYRPSRLRNILVVVQVAVCALLLISAAITLRGERTVASQDTGLDPRGVFGVHVGEKLRVPVAARLRAEPRVSSVGAFLEYPVASQATGDGRTLRMNYMLTSPEYFDIFRIPMMRGRNFSQAESKTEAAVVVVSETAARRLWPGQDAVGRTVTFPRTAPFYVAAHPASALVIGVARDSFQDWDEQGQPQRACLYFPTYAGSSLRVLLLVGMKGQIGIESARRIIAADVDAVAPGGADNIESQEDAQASRLMPFRILLAITGFLGALALLMTLSGVYGVLSYLVTQRRREFGIRIALGAAGQDVAAMVFRQSLKLAALGAAAGALFAYAAAKIIGNNVQPIDPLDWRGYAGGVLVVLAAALAASCIPARRAVRVDPAVTLRCD